jgi:hypothetical protein
MIFYLSFCILDRHNGAKRRTSRQLVAIEATSVPIIIAEEQVFPLDDLPKHVPQRQRGKPLHLSTCYRWAHYGVKGIKLETVRVAGTLCTSVESFQRWCDALTALDLRKNPAAVQGKRAGRTAAQKASAVKKAEAELKKMGAV